MYEYFLRRSTRSRDAARTEWSEFGWIRTVLVGQQSIANVTELLSIFDTAQSAFGRCYATASRANTRQLSDTVSRITGTLVKFLAALQLRLVGGHQFTGVRHECPDKQRFRSDIHIRRAHCV